MFRLICIVILLNLTDEYYFHNKTHIINMVKEKVYQYCMDDDSGSCNRLDLGRLKQRDILIWKILERNMYDVIMVAQKLTNIFQYFHKEKLNEMSVDYFPSEFYATGYIFDSKWRLQNGQRLGSIAGRCFISSRSISYNMYDLFKKFIIWTAFKNNWLNFNKKSGKLIINTKDVGGTNFDYGFCREMIKILDSLEPSSLESWDYLVTDMNPIVNIPYRGILERVNSILQNKIILTSIDHVDKYGVDLQSLPEYLGGYLHGYHRIPYGVKSGKCLFHLKYITDKEWNIFRRRNIECIKEGMNEINATDIDKYLRSNC